MKEIDNELLKYAGERYVNPVHGVHVVLQVSQFKEDKEFPFRIGRGGSLVRKGGRSHQEI